MTVFENNSGPESEKTWKSIQVLLRENELKHPVKFRNCGLFWCNFNYSSYLPFSKKNLWNKPYAYLIEPLSFQHKLVTFIYQNIFKQVIFTWEKLQQLYPHIQARINKSRLQTQVEIPKTAPEKKKSYNIAKGNLFSLASITVNMLRQKQSNFFFELIWHAPPTTPHVARII